MSRIGNHLAAMYYWLGGSPKCERERTRRKILLTMSDVRLHTPGI